MNLPRNPSPIHSDTSSRMAPGASSPPYPRHVPLLLPHFTLQHPSQVLGGRSRTEGSAAPGRAAGVHAWPTPTGPVALPTRPQGRSRAAGDPGWCPAWLLSGRLLRHSCPQGPRGVGQPAPCSSEWGLLSLSCLSSSQGSQAPCWGLQQVDPGCLSPSCPLTPQQGQGWGPLYCLLCPSREVRP